VTVEQLVSSHQRTSCTLSLFIGTAAATISYNLTSLQLVQGLAGPVGLGPCPPVLPDAATAAEASPAVCAQQPHQPQRPQRRGPVTCLGL